MVPDVDAELFEVLNVASPLKKKKKEEKKDDEEEEMSSEQQERAVIRSTLQAAQILSASQPAPVAVAASTVPTCVDCSCRCTPLGDLVDVPVVGVCPACCHHKNLHT